MQNTLALTLTLILTHTHTNTQIHRLRRTCVCVSVCVWCIGSGSCSYMAGAIFVSPKTCCGLRPAGHTREIEKSVVINERAEALCIFVSASLLD